MDIQVFIPTDKAFLKAGLGPGSMAALPQEIVENLLLYHTLHGAIVEADIEKDATLFTALNIDLRTQGAVLVDSLGERSNIVEADVACSNGYLHVVDGVLMPPDLMTSLSTYNAKGGPYEGVFDVLQTSLDLTNMSRELSGLKGPYTVSLGRSSVSFIGRQRGLLLCAMPSPTARSLTMLERDGASFCCSRRNYCRPSISCVGEVGCVVGR